MAHRNRWFTELKNGGSFHGKLLVITRGYDDYQEISGVWWGFHQHVVSKI